MIRQTINEQSIISSGLGLSKNFILGHTSSGAYHYVLGRIMPQFTSFLKPGSSSLPVWQVAANLQLGAQGILDKLINEFGQDLIIRSGFKALSPNQIPSVASFGQSFDIQIKGFENNMYGVAKTIQNLSKRASNLQLVYGNTSYMKIGYDEKSIFNNILTNELPKLTTSDVLNNILEQGLTSIAGI